MITADTLRRVASLGLSRSKLESVLGIIADMDEAQMRFIDTDRSVSDEAHRSPNDTDGTERENGPFPLDKERSPTPPKEIKPLSHSQNAREIDAIANEFEAHFWTKYPNKVGKPDALTAFRRARLGHRVKGKPTRQPVPLQEILAGVSRYIISKPEGREWLNPATFLNQERYADQPAGQQPTDQNTPQLPDWDARARFFASNGWRDEWGEISDVPAEFKPKFQRTDNGFTKLRGAA